MLAVEAEARELTYRAHFRRNFWRLFPLPPIVCETPEDWAKLDDAYFGLAVGVMPVGTPDSRSEIAVGEWRGFSSAPLGGISLQIRHFGHFGSTLHRSPLNIGYVHVLPEAFQRIVEADWASQGEDGRETCGYCSYEFKGTERRCDCHGYCGGCCLNLTLREERGYDKMLDQMTGKAA